MACAGDSTARCRQIWLRRSLGSVRETVRRRPRPSVATPASRCCQRPAYPCGAAPCTVTVVPTTVAGWLSLGVLAGGAASDLAAGLEPGLAPARNCV